MAEHTSTKIERVVNELSRRIDSGVYRTGQRLPSEREFMEELGVSRGTIREALKKLQAENIIDIVPSSGAFVHSTSSIQVTPESDKAFSRATQGGVMQALADSSASFVRATPRDMDALYKMAVKLFPHTVGPERRKEWIRHEPRGHYVMKRDDGSVVAYLYLLALKRDRRDLEPEHRDRLAMYLRRELRNTQITASDIHQFVPGQPVDIVIGGIGSDPELEQEQRIECAAQLLHGVRHDLENLGREGFIFSNAYAFSETRDGIALCVKLGMHQWEAPRGRFFTFQLDILNSPSILFKGYRRGLTEYQTHTN